MDTRTLEIGSYDSLSEKLTQEGVSEEEKKKRLMMISDRDYKQLINMNRKERRRWLKSKRSKQTRRTMT